MNLSTLCASVSFHFDTSMMGLNCLVQYITSSGVVSSVSLAGETLVPFTPGRFLLGK
jgi:hypothetical protein